MVSVDTGLVAKIRGGLSVQPGVRIQQDLAPTLFRVDGEPAGELTQTALSITVALRIDTRRSPKGPLGIDEGSIAAHQDTNGS
jgi:hypothetical protein